MSDLVEVSEETKALMARADVFKDEGNEFLKKHKYSLAAAKYTQAIELFPTAIYYSNRAQALIKLESYGLAIQDANESLKLDPKYLKAYYRRGSANFALGKLKVALKDFKTVATILPKDADAQKKLKACDKAVKEEAFQKAIESEEDSNINVDANSIVVDASYTGPALVADENGNVNITTEFAVQVMAYFKDQKRLHRKYVLQVLAAGIRHFEALPSLLRLYLPSEPQINSENVPLINAADVTVNGTFTVCGDTHGQYYDLCNIFALGGMPSDSNRYLFNGDFVDRGSFSFETVFTLLLLKLANPVSLNMLRGNHETKNMNAMYGFLGEIKHKYDDTVMKMFTRLFQCLPLAAVIQDKVFVVHGGLSTQEGGVSLRQIEQISRFREPDTGLMSDLLWSDPHPQKGRAPSKRGVGFSFGPDYTAAFLAQNNLTLLIRSHEMQEEGYTIDHDGQCITVFSAPNYCDQMGNQGAFIRFNELTMQPAFTKFSAVAHPNVPPMAYAGNMNNFI